MLPSLGTEANPVSLWETLVGLEMETGGGRETGTVCTHHPPPTPPTRTSCIPFLSDTLPVSPPALQTQPTAASPPDDSGCTTHAAGRNDTNSAQQTFHRWA